MSHGGGGSTTRPAGQGQSEASRSQQQPSEAATSTSGREEHIRMLQRYRAQWQDSGSLLQRSARRVHKTLWWLMCFTGLDVLDYHERVLFSLGYLAVLILVLAGACKQIHTLIEVWREVLRQRMPVVNGAG